MKQIVVAFLIVFNGAACADEPVERFYRGKVISLYVGTAAGNDFGLRAELVSRHMKRNIPGEPTIVIRYMPGAGGVIAANYLANLAPQDGTALLASQYNMATLQAVETPAVKFDASRFHWIGNTSDSQNVISVWHTTEIKALEDVRSREVLIGAIAGNASIYYMNALNVLVGTRFKAITGYDGAAAVSLAMERGEVMGRASSFASWNASHPHWIADRKIRHVVQIGLKKSPEHPDIPLLMDLARNDFDRNVLRFLSADTAMARPIATTPNVPVERVVALRKAFDAAVADPQFLVEAEKSKIEISVSSGEQVQQLVNSIVKTDPAVVARAKELMTQH